MKGKSIVLVIFSHQTEYVCSIFSNKMRHNCNNDLTGARKSIKCQYNRKDNCLKLQLINLSINYTSVNDDSIHLSIIHNQDQNNF